jgi:hypothetical protein
LEESFWFTAGPPTSSRCFFSYNKLTKMLHQSIISK